MADLSRRGFLAALGVAGGALALSTAGCSSLMPRGTGADGVRIHTSLGGTSPGANVFSAAMADFRKTHPELDVAVLTNGSDLPIVYETSRLARKEAEVVMVNLIGNQLTWLGYDATVDVSGYLTQWGLEDRVLPQALDEWSTSGGNLQAFPYFASNWPVAFNTRLLASVDRDVPRTADELVATARALRKKKLAPIVVGGSDWTGQKLFCQIIQAYVTQDAAREYFRNGDVAAHPGIKQGIEHFVELRKAGVFVDNAQGLTSDAMSTMYNASRAAGQMAMTSALSSVPEKVAAVSHVGGWPLAHGSVHDRPTMMRGYSVLGIWISPNGTKKLEAVEEVVKYLYSPEVADRFVTESGRDLAVRTTARSTKFPLVAATQDLTDDDVSPALLPDLSVPGPVNNPLIQASALAYGTSSTVPQIVAALDNAYRSA